MTFRNFTISDILKMLALTQPKLPKQTQTINGKLVGQDPNQFEYINSQMENLAQQLEQIEIQVVTAQQQDRREYINQLKLLKASVQNLEQLYNRLLSTTIVTVVVLTALLIWMGLIRQPSYNKSQINTTVIALQN
ncbi:hypothetical protein [Argonema antarcticum]|uniref:hypothetical protein n=1 Tax=Argonema antarcticum TaxID=2942763 RepID=UPI00201248B3|nr:hypothetical protein [Argonema antarcticum]MCL1475857.1 hypothetical protein [Argonema antarcticum A004/B2]